MKFRLPLIMVQENGPEQVQDLAELERLEGLRSETTGLTLAESKQILQTLQQAVVEQQAKPILPSARTVRLVARSSRSKVIMN